jgi:uncharacterized phosphosugar-binding protein
LSGPIYLEFLERIQSLQRRIAEEEQANILRGAQAIADQLAQDKVIHVIGTGGHSYIGAEEIFFRAGGLFPVNAILDEGFSLGQGAIRSMMVERTPGYAKAVLKYYDLQPGDLLIIVNAYGINSATIDSALFCRENGITAIGVTSVELQRQLPKGHESRHPSGQDLCDVVDIVIDTKVPPGDALMSIPGVTQKVGSCSTFANALAMQSLMMEAVAELARRGIDPPIWQSANSVGGDAANRANTAKYKYRIKKL